MKNPEAQKAMKLVGFQPAAQAAAREVSFLKSAPAELPDWIRTSTDAFSCAEVALVGRASAENVEDRITADRQQNYLIWRYDVQDAVLIRALHHDARPAEQCCYT